MTKSSILAAAALLLTAANALTINIPSAGGVPSSPLMYGIMFEVRAPRLLANGAP